jgi:hypothetical protein
MYSQILSITSIFLSIPFARAAIVLLIVQKGTLAHLVLKGPPSRTAHLALMYARSASLARKPL